MYDTYGPTYEYYIEKNTADFVSRLNDRVKKEKWVSIEELLKVN